MLDKPMGIKGVGHKDPVKAELEPLPGGKSDYPVQALLEVFDLHAHLVCVVPQGRPARSCKLWLKLEASGYDLEELFAVQLSQGLLQADSAYAAVGAGDVGPDVNLHADSLQALSAEAPSASVKASADGPEKRKTAPGYRAFQKETLRGLSCLSWATMSRCIMPSASTSRSSTCSLSRKSMVGR